MRYDTLCGTEFLRRAGLIPATYQPLPTMQPGEMKIHRYRMQNPFSTDQVLERDSDRIPVDRYQQETWPVGSP